MIQAQTHSRTTLLHALALVLGFTSVFTFLGASVGLLGGYALYDILPAITRVGVILLTVFGLRVIHGYLGWALVVLALGAAGALVVFTLLNNFRLIYLGLAVLLVVFGLWAARLRAGYLGWALMALALAALTFLLARFELTPTARLVSAVLIGLTALAAADWDRLVLAVLAILIAGLSWLTSDSQGIGLRLVESAFVAAIVYFGYTTSFFDREMRFDMGGRFGSVSYGRSFLIGIIFAAGWTPCVGPILSGILLLAQQTQTVGQGALLLAVYSAGLGIPFLIAGALFSQLTRYLPRFYRHLPAISAISGVLLVLIGLLMFTDSLQQLARYGAFVNLEESFGLDSSAGVTLALAFLGGLLSFASPCVLPLVPAYLGYLSGAAIGSARATPTPAPA